ncbi:MAG TPA: aminotransferase DegT [Prolixibacteraceae bacterium]|nr:aminotransferase DegT [Prolixibacteraceae bacterium]
MIPVTKSFLPPLEDYVEYLKKIWESNQLTNHGPLVNELESRLKEYLGVKHLFFVSNGTIALQIAIKALALQGEVITTPFSYVATTSSIVWEGCQPVFVDIDPKTLCLDPDLIEAAITPQTSAIIATHVYGIPCAVEKIQAIAEKHNLKVVYDAAHTFGVKYQGRSLVSYGDIATLSFHATKLFHTVEGGAIITEDDELAHRISYMRNFGHNGQEAFWGLGVNGKNSEFHAAMGLCNLPHFAEIVASRRQVSEWYDELLVSSSLVRPTMPGNTEYNFAYYPVLFQSELKLLRARDMLNEQQIFPRRYFFPSLNKLPYAPDREFPVAEASSSCVLCLPLYPDLSRQDVQKITDIIILATKG